MNARILSVTLSLGLLTLLALPAQGQSPEALIERGTRAGADRALLQELRSRAAESGLSDDAAARLLEPPVTLAEEGLPSRFAVQRGLEGLAKGVAPDRIAAVLQDIRQATARAGAIGDPWLQRPEVQQRLQQTTSTREVMLESIAQALHRDLPEPALETFLNRFSQDVERPRSPAATAAAIHTLPDLIEAGTDAEASARLLTAALEANSTASELRQFPAAVRAAQQQSRQPPAAIARGAAQQIAQGAPAASVLSSLFQGTFPGQGPPGLQNRPDPNNGGGPPNTPPGRGNN